MTRFLTDTLTDMRNGRETWRVFVAFCTPSFALAIGAGLLQRIG